MSNVERREEPIFRWLASAESFFQLVTNAILAGPIAPTLLAWRYVTAHVRR